MSREIKFRYWNVGRRVMIENVGFHPHILMNIDAMEDWEEEYKPDSPGSIIRNEKSEHGILMQFTGIKDIHGVEIYEGDIVSANGYYYKKTHDMSQARRFVSSNIPDSYETILGSFPFIVEWDSVFTGWAFNSGVHHIATNISERNHKVIGNIYQNPDLIKTLNVEE